MYVFKNGGLNHFSFVELLLFLFVGANLIQHTKADAKQVNCYEQNYHPKTDCLQNVNR